MEYKRYCAICGRDISDHPLSHDLCYGCWKEVNGYSTTRNNYSSYSDDYVDYEKPEKYSLRDALDGDEWAYYNLYGELPSDEDW